MIRQRQSVISRTGCNSSLTLETPPRLFILQRCQNGIPRTAFFETPSELLKFRFEINVGPDEFREEVGLGALGFDDSFTDCYVGAGDVGEGYGKVGFFLGEDGEVYSVVGGLFCFVACFWRL